MGKASRRKRERRMGLRPLPSHPFGQTLETPPLPKPSPGRKKISTCLGEMILPYLPPEAGIREWRMGIAMASVAWNLALLPAAERAREIERMFQNPDADELDDPLLLKDLLLLLIAQKLRFYPGDPRAVLSWEIRKAGGSRFHITVMAALPEELPEERQQPGGRFLERTGAP